MNWFLAKIVYRIICGDGDHTPQFDEQLRLVTAENEKDALQKAFSIGKQEEDCFYNNAEKLVQWKFINVAELYKIANLIDGAELYSRIEEKENGDLYTELVHKRAAHLQLNSTQQYLQPL
ncbi:MAG: DUF4288 domain-containing protein [Terrimonas sp.]|uniref:DUF4288 domain-containing protein n=1 Tax=Terrimonas sp. TaxID=1914338 RepID=UPI0009278EC8|nr:DUF4288 domain-containing protein [Terrimonas sp.]MBN8789849.1 DUF4288 domain-containing protein [Terrimonas sp.]OJY97846.1 MAG: hypothetical protein BGP13_19065 [Sphingobacteriales bacterium 40-81]PVD54130.1 DUF4288 domain-containing protein [Terrimonas sp.]